MTAAEVYESITNGGTTDFSDVVSILDQNKPWCLIGGLAVNCYVEPVYTIDVDLVVVAANLDRIERELITERFEVRRFEHSLNAQRFGSKLNVRFRIDPRYQDFLSNTTDREVLGLRVPVATLESITRGKVWAWQDAKRRLSQRKKDELDLIRIAETHPEMRHLIPNEILAQLGVSGT